MKIIVDTNIIFSALLNTNGTIGDLLMNSGKAFDFYSCDYMRHEIQNHWKKLQKISKLSAEELGDSYFQIASRIHFINESLIPGEIWQKAINFTKEVDLDDTAFVALTIYLKGSLWTGDKELYNGIKIKGFKRVFNTEELKLYRADHNYR
ncbi:MAG: PIN domain-containing protein [Bacteroidota bacterium]